jgi:catechol 2,3-dioxygenase
MKETEMDEVTTAEAAEVSSYEGVTPIKVNKLGHLVYEVSDVERTVKFWTEVMGFQESDRNDIGMVFFRCGSDHHGIGLKPAKSKSRPETGTALKVEHLALEVDNVDILFKAREFLEKNDIPIVFQGRKGAGSNLSLHFLDPDGYEFELYCGLDQIDETGRSRPAEQYHRVKTLEDAVANPLPKTW